ncbi:MAG: DUF1223 domain-containing protein [Thermoanaerobaculia bacterium]
MGLLLLGLLASPGGVAGADDQGGPVLVELFTSQGCSSCPPADRLLARLGEESDGAVVPLAFHIDSWNYLGWTDPFSSSAWTSRQAAYTRALKATPYTPQVVVGGRVEVLGSDERAIREAVAAAAATPRGELSLAVALAGSRLEVTVEVELPEELRDRKLDLMVAVFESGLVTPVERGENGGHTMHNDYVVRRLERAGRVRPRDPARSSHSVSLKVADDWRRSELGVAAFLQEAGSLVVHGVAVQTFPESAGG